MLTLTHVLVAIAVVTGWALFVLISPITRCRRCHGKAIIRTRFRKRIRACPRCGGSRRQYRLGANAVHRLAEPGRDALKRRIRARHHPEA
jgi:hypothetical protein